MHKSESCNKIYIPATSIGRSNCYLLLIKLFNSATKLSTRFGVTFCLCIGLVRTFLFTLGLLFDVVVKLLLELLYKCVDNREKPLKWIKNLQAVSSYDVNRIITLSLSCNILYLNTFLFILLDIRANALYCL